MKQPLYQLKALRQDILSVQRKAEVTNVAVATIERLGRPDRTLSRQTDGDNFEKEQKIAKCGVLLQHGGGRA